MGLMPELFIAAVAVAVLVIAGLIVGVLARMKLCEWDGGHKWRNLYGDEINLYDCRAICINCGARSADLR